MEHIYEAKVHEGLILECTNKLRWVAPPETTTKSPRLQQAWRDIKTGELQWRDVPCTGEDQP